MRASPFSAAVVAAGAVVLLGGCGALIGFDNLVAPEAPDASKDAAADTTRPTDAGRDARADVTLDAGHGDGGRRDGGDSGDSGRSDAGRDGATRADAGDASPASCDCLGSGGAGTCSSCNCGVGDSGVDLATDPTNCGGCGQLCGDGGTCQNATCQCTAPHQACFGTCKDTRNDRNNCGACNHQCGAGSCDDGGCVCATPFAVCEGACVDTRSDTNNCGGCGRTCIAGGSCNAGQCSVVVLVSDPNAPYGIALSVSASKVYWTNMNGDVSSAPLDGGTFDSGTAKVLARKTQSLTNGTEGIAVDSTQVYWVDTDPNHGSVMAATLDGGDVRTLVPPPVNYPYAVAVNGSGDVFFTVGNSEFVEEVASSGGAVSQVVASTFNEYDFQGIRATATHVYWTTQTEVMWSTLDGANVSMFATGSVPLALASDSTFLYWTNMGSGTVVKAKLDGSGTPITLAPAGTAAYGIAVDSRNVYWVAQPNVMSVPLDGGTPTQLATGTLPHAVATDGKSVYFTDSTAVMRVFLPQ